MPYVVDRQRALPGWDIIAVLSIRGRRTRSRVVMGDNSLYETLTRPTTFIRRVNEEGCALPRRAPRRQP